MAEEIKLPRWAAKKRTSVPIGLLLGAVIAALHATAALTDIEAARSWTGFLAVPAGASLILIYALLFGFRRVAVGAVAPQASPLHWSLLYLAFAMVLLLFAVLWLLAGTVLAWVLDLQAKRGLTQALIVAVLHFCVLSLILKVAANVGLLLRHRSKR